jgi:hypothetical protein
MSAVMEEQMQSVDWDTYYAAHRFGLVSAHGGRKTTPVRETLADGACPLRGQHIGEITEFVAVGGEVLSRKVVACDATETWLRRDLAADARAALADEAAAGVRAIAKVLAWRDRTDAENAAKRGMTVEDYRKLRNAQGHRSEMRSGRNSIGM